MQNRANLLFLVTTGDMDLSSSSASGCWGLGMLGMRRDHLRLIWTNSFCLGLLLLSLLALRGLLSRDFLSSFLHLGILACLLGSSFSSSLLLFMELTLTVLLCDLLVVQPDHSSTVDDLIFELFPLLFRLFMCCSIHASKSITSPTASCIMRSVSDQ